MIQNSEIRLEGELPFLKDDCITGVGLTPSQAEAARASFRWSGYSFVDIESALRSMSPALAEYAFPGAAFSTSDLDVRAFVSSFVTLPSEGPCLIRKDRSGLYCLPLKDEDGSGNIGPLVEYSHSLEEPLTMFHVSNACMEYDHESPKDGIAEKRKYSRHVRKHSLKERVFDELLEGMVMPGAALRDENSVPVLAEPEAELDPKTQEIIRAIDEIQQKYGISIEQLDAILSYKVKLSHLHISRSGKIILTDFGNKEVKLDTLSKALFFLYLKHPEGIRFKSLTDHRAELKSIYMGITGREDIAEIEKSLDDIVDPLSNAVNVKTSRIKAAFRNVVADRVARFYYIDGPSGSDKKILIDRDYVIWEQ